MPAHDAGGPRAGGSPLPSPGERLGGYVLERLLGRGGMGAVYVGANEAGTRRAIKVPVFEGPSAEEWRVRFEREACALAKLPPHPHILRVHGAGTERGHAYCVLELVEGEGLDRIVKRDGPLPVPRALEIAEQVARAVAHAHATGILHRDLKPANVMIRAEDGSAVLMDFGLARDKEEAERLTTTGVSLGTPAYMAPEQGEGQKGVDERADVYGVGAILYELLAGAPPFAGSTSMEILKKVLLDPPAPFSSRRADVPRDVETIVLRAMAKLRVARYRTALALAEDIARARRGEPIAARRAGLRERLALRLRRVPWRALARILVVALAVGAIALGAVEAWKFFDRRSNQANKLETWLLQLEAAKEKVARERQALRGAWSGLEAPADLAALESAVTVFEELAKERPARASQREVDILALRREVDRACAHARAEACLAKRDVSSAREILGRVAESDDDGRRRLLLAAADLFSGGAARARDTFVEIEGGAARDPALAAEAALGFAHADVALGRASQAIEKVREVEKRLARDQSLGSLKRALRPPLEGAYVLLAKEAAQRGGRDAWELLGKVARETDPVYGGLRERVVAGLIQAASDDLLADLYKRDRYVFGRCREAAPFLLRRSKAALAALDFREALHAIAAARLADQGATAPRGLSDVARTEAWNAWSKEKFDHWLDLMLAMFRAGFGDPAITTEVDERLGLGVLESKLEKLTKTNPDDWAAKLLLSSRLFDDYRERTTDRDHERGERLVREVLDHRDLTPQCRPFALKQLAYHLRARAELRGAEDSSWSERLETAAREFLKAEAEGDGYPDECCGNAAWDFLRAGRVDDAIASARRAAAHAEDRVGRFERRTDEALAEGRARGLPLSGLIRNVVATRVGPRELLLYGLVVRGHLPEAERVVGEIRGIEGDAERTRLAEAMLRFARGESDEAVRLIRAGLDTCLKLGTGQEARERRERFRDALANLATALLFSRSELAKQGRLAWSESEKVGKAFEPR